MAPWAGVLASHELSLVLLGSNPALILVPAAAAAKSLQSCPTLCGPIDSSPPGSLSLGFSRQEHWSGLPFPSPMYESEVAQSCPTLSNSRHCSPPGSSIHGIFQAKVLEWGAIAFSNAHRQNISIQIEPKIPSYPKPKTTFVPSRNRHTDFAHVE